MAAAPNLPDPAPSAPGPRWRLVLLGGLRLEDGSTVHTRFATRAIALLLVRLALWPRRDHPREELVELLWPDVDAEVGRRRLRQALSLLRTVLEPPQGHPWPVLQADRTSVRLVPGAIACDVHAFEALVRDRRHDAALACYAGDLLPGFFDDWVHEERTRLAALHDRMADAAERSTAADVPTPLPRLTAPASAPAVTAVVMPVVMPAVAPAPVTAIDALAPRTGAPSYVTRYFSHPAQSARLLDAVRTHRLVCLLGPGGSGKTRLAVELVDRLGRERGTTDGADAPPSAHVDGFELVVFVPLAAAQTQEQLLGALQAALQIGATPCTVDHLVARLEGRRALLALDNAEQLAEIAAGLLSLLATALPRLHLLVTSRRRLGVDGEREFHIEPLPLPEPGASLAATADTPAVGLFVDRARAVRGDFHLGPRNQAAIADLVRVLEGMPLAIELAASRIRAFTPSEMLARLSRPAGHPGGTPGLDLLARPELRSTVQSRHASMQRAIDWSWSQLDPTLQRLAAAMAVFPGGCDAAMLAAVEGDRTDHRDGDGNGNGNGDGDGDTRGGVAIGLEQLHADSLIHEVRGLGAEEAPRFQLYVPIREYAAARVGAADGARWRDRQRAWAIGWLRGLPATPPLGRVRAEIVNLCAALDSAAADGAGDATAALLTGLQPLHEGVTLPTETLARARAALPTCADAALRSRGASALAPLLLTAGDGAEARRMAEAALADAPLQGLARAWALQALAYVHWRGALSPATAMLPWVEEAGAIADAAPAPDLQAMVLGVAALVHFALDGDAEAARDRFSRAGALWDALGNRHGVNLARHNVAVYEFHCGHREQALRTWDVVSAEAVVLEDVRRLAIANSARSAALALMRRWPQALAASQESLAQSWRGMRLYELAYDLWNLPRVLAHLRRPRDAICLMTFASQFWQQRFGPLTDVDRRDLLRVERLVARQIDARASAEAAARGREMTLADAVALILGA